MLELAIPIYNIDLGYAQRLLADVPDEKMCDQPVAGRVMNHASFVLGHLAWVSGFGGSLIGHPQSCPPEWKDLFSSAAKPLPDVSHYPSKAVLLNALEEQHERLLAAVAGATPEMLAELPPERMRGRFPTIAHVLLHMLTSHEAVHLGQLSAWRRAQGLPSV